MTSKCSICIATYRRPALLTNLLFSLQRQSLREDINIEVIVVDNDADASAMSVIKNFEHIEKLALRYYIQPLKNISLTRNKAVEEAHGDLLLFIDDDEIASPFWVSNMTAAIEKYDADGVFGRVLSDFHDGTPYWVKQSSLFNRPCLPTGTKAQSMRTGNCLIKSSILKCVPGPFDITYGITGGEDTHLFEKLQNLGAKFINCKEAWIVEHVSPERTRIKSILKRAFNRGNTYARRVLELSTGGKKRTQLENILKSMIYIPGSIFLSAIGVAHRSWCLNWAVKTASNTGRLFALLGFNYKGYK